MTLDNVRRLFDRLAKDEALRKNLYKAVVDLMHPQEEAKAASQEK